MPPTCSLRDRAFGELAPQLYWIILCLGTDMAPVLIHNCSRECTLSVPGAPAGCFPQPRQVGPGMPPG